MNKYEEIIKNTFSYIDLADIVEVYKYAFTESNINYKVTTVREGVVQQYIVICSITSEGVTIKSVAYYNHNIYLGMLTTVCNILNRNIKRGYV